MSKLILIIDDSQMVRAQMRTFLEQEGYRVEEAVDGEEGLARTLELEPDLLLCDVSMPKMNGLDMLAELRERGVRTPAFVLTTETTTQMVERGRQVRATAWMVKPFKPNALRSGIERVLGTS